MNKSTVNISNARHIPRRGSTLILVLWAVGITTLIVLSLQVSAYRQSSAGYEAMGRVRARWAARAGVEACVAYIAWEVENQDSTDPVTLKATLEDLSDSEDEFERSSYRITHIEEGEVLVGPDDAHGRINVNLMTEEQWMQLDGMTEDVVMAILDWIDADDNPRDGGAEAGSYQQLFPPYEPRNKPFRSLIELELVHNMDSEYLRGEDWNLNGTLDPNEDDGDLSWPPDNEDGYLDAGWSALLTATSRDGGFGPSGQEKINLAQTDDQTAMERLGVTILQAQALRAFAANGDNSLGGLITTDLSTIGSRGTSETGENAETLGAADLTDEQLRFILAESTMGGISQYIPGKVNLNTASREVLELLPDMTSTLADQIFYMRQSNARGIESVMDLLEIPGVDEQRLESLVEHVDVRSNVFRVTSRGTSQPGGTEVELIVTIDRTSLPMRFLEYTER